MMGRLLIGVSKLEQSAVAVWPALECDSGRQAINGKPGRNRDCRDECQERTHCWNAGIGSVRPPTEQLRLKLDGFVDDSVDAIIRHDLQHVEHQLFSSLEMLIILSLVDGVDDCFSSH